MCKQNYTKHNKKQAYKLERNYIKIMHFIQFKQKKNCQNKTYVLVSI